MTRQDGYSNDAQQGHRRMAGALKKTILLIVGGIAVLAVIAAIVAYFFLRPSSEPAGPSNPLADQESPLTPQVAPSVAKTVASANKAVTKALDEGGDQKEAGVAVYQKAITDTSDKKEQAALWIKQAEFLSIQGDNQAAIAAALDAEKINGETLETTTMLALLYELTGDNANAAIYYRKAAEHVLKEASDETLYNPENEAEYYREKANQLENQ